MCWLYSGAARCITIAHYWLLHLVSNILVLMVPWYGDCLSRFYQDSPQFWWPDPGKLQGLLGCWIAPNSKPCPDLLSSDVFFSAPNAQNLFLAWAPREWLTLPRPLIWLRRGYSPHAPIAPSPQCLRCLDLSATFFASNGVPIFCRRCMVTLTGGHFGYKYCRNKAELLCAHWATARYVFILFTASSIISVEFIDAFTWARFVCVYLVVFESMESLWVAAEYVRLS